MSRRQARELALQVLFHVDVGRADADTALFQAFAREAETEATRDVMTENEKVFTRDLVLGTWERREVIDKIIVRYAKEWSVERMAAVDRNILRLAIYEILHQGDIPDSVSADEAVDLAKTFSTAESGKFVNGILGSVIRGLRQGVAQTESPVPGK